MDSFAVKLNDPHPLARAGATVLGIAGTLAAKQLGPLGFAWLAVVVPLAVLTGIWRQHARFVLTVVAPITVALLFVWGWVVGAPPGAVVGSSPAGGVRFACLVGLRLAVLGGITQLCFLTVPTARLATTLRHWGLRGDGLIITLGAFALLPELRLRADQVLTARYARGFLRKANFVGRALQFPHLLRPLFAWALRSAIQRSECWHQRGLIARIVNARPEAETWSIGLGTLYLGLGAGWLAYNVAVMIGIVM